MRARASGPLGPLAVSRWGVGMAGAALQRVGWLPELDKLSVLALPRHRRLSGTGFLKLV